MVCNNCGKEFDDAFEKCPYCGEKTIDNIDQKVDDLVNVTVQDIQEEKSDAKAEVEEKAKDSTITAIDEVAAEKENTDPVNGNPIEDEAIKKLAEKQKNKKAKKWILIASACAAVAAIIIIFVLVVNNNLRHSQIEAFKKDTVDKQLGEAKLTVPVSWNPSEESGGKVVYELKDQFGNQAYVFAEYEKAELPQSNYDLYADKREDFEANNNVRLNINHDFDNEEDIKGVDAAKSFTYEDTRNGEKWSYSGYFIPISGEGVFTLIYGVPEKTEYNRYEKDFESLYNRLYISFMANDDEAAIKKNTIVLGDKTCSVGYGTTIDMKLTKNIAKNIIEILANVKSDSLDIGKWAFLTLNSSILDSKIIDSGWLIFTAGDTYMGDLQYKDGVLYNRLLCDENGDYSSETPAWVESKPSDDDLIASASVLTETQKAFNELIGASR